MCMWVHNSASPPAGRETEAGAWAPETNLRKSDSLAVSEKRARVPETWDPVFRPTLRLLDLGVHRRFG